MQVQLNPFHMKRKKKERKKKHKMIWDKYL